MSALSLLPTVVHHELVVPEYVLVIIILKLIKQLTIIFLLLADLQVVTQVDHFLFISVRDHH